jgi:hypothetical protein
MTVAYMTELDAKGRCDSAIAIATSVCHSRDAYNRKEGVKSTRQRFAAGNVVYVPVPSRNLHEFLSWLEAPFNSESIFSPADRELSNAVRAAESIFSAVDRELDQAGSRE